ncbi:hypothetical protein KA093_03960 [Candidatus Saccharibacteria bacterium]|nr:hypothetical protein [Candidatus Saccharibacteria bacterium]
MRKYVAQEDSMGCGVACVANRLGISYANALELFDEPERAGTIGYACKYIVTALQRGGVEARLHHIKRVDRTLVATGELPLPNGAIVLLEKSVVYPYQHYLLKVEVGWCDPWINMHENSDIIHAESGVRSELPGQPYYAVY